MNDFDFKENIAELLEPSQLANIAAELVAGIEADDSSRSEMIEDMAKGLDILAIKLEAPRTDAGSSAAPMEGMSNARHPLALEAAIRFRANFLGEFLPADGPVKVENTGIENMFTQDEAQLLEDNMNLYLTTTATEYQPDTDRMAFGLAWDGNGFKKGYHCPIRRRPVIESVPIKDLIISNDATDLQNAERITHRITMSRQILRRMQLAKAYRDIDLPTPNQYYDRLDQKEKRTQGLEPNNTRPEDNKYTIYECYCYLDIQGFEHQDENEELTGLPLPYKVSIDKTTLSILEIRRDWKEDDTQCLRRKHFVHYPFEPMFGFYAVGFLKLLGNTTNTLTAAWRILIDAGMFGNFPGWIHAKQGDRQLNNNFRCAPGSGIAVEVPVGMSLHDAFMALPYKTPDPVFVQLVDNIDQRGQRLGMTSEIQVGDGRQDAPVGSTVAMLEQATKQILAVHKRNHIAQSEEFQILRELFIEDPEALWRHNPKIAPWVVERLLAALNNLDLVPRASPNVPSHMHRMLQAQGLKMMAQGNPAMYDMRKVDAYALRQLRIDQPEQFFAPPQPPQPAQADPRMLSVAAKQQSDAQNHQFKLVELAASANEKAKDRQHQMEIEKLKVMRELAVHPDAAPLVTGNPV